MGGVSSLGGWGVFLPRTGESANQADKLELRIEEEEEEAVEDSEEGSEEDSPRSLFLFFLGGLERASGFGLGFVLFLGRGFVLAWGAGFGTWVGDPVGGHSQLWPQVGGGEQGPGIGRQCCPSPPLVSPRRYSGRLDGPPGPSAPPVLQVRCCSRVVGWTGRGSHPGHRIIRRTARGSPGLIYTSSTQREESRKMFSGIGPAAFLQSLVL